MGAGCKNNCPTCRCAKTATIIGAGLVGSLWAIYLSKAGYMVSVFERRQDMRQEKISAGKSINLAISERGWRALDALQIGNEIREMAIPMYGRTLHTTDGHSGYQPYGIDKQAIYSVSRGALNSRLMSLAEAHGAHIHFAEECIGTEPEEGIARFRNSDTMEESEIKSDVIFACDGAFSATRYLHLQKLDGFNFSQRYIQQGYREILLPAHPDGSPRLQSNTLHIWPRGDFMLIALPNADHSFTCTLFMPRKDHEYSFENVEDTEMVNAFFRKLFPDFYAIHPAVGEEWKQHPLSSLAIIRCFPWSVGKLLLMGDAAHATVPFFGQGMNCGFEDCTVLDELMKEFGDNWKQIFKAFETKRKPDTDAMQELSLRNFTVMSQQVSNPEYQLIQRMERRMAELFPERYFPLYSMVSFTTIPYHIALAKGEKQENSLRQLIQTFSLWPDCPDEMIDHALTTGFDLPMEKEFQHTES